LCHQKTDSNQKDVTQHQTRPKQDRKENGAGKYYEPVWNGKCCKDPVDVGLGKGSCNTDCDCPLCSPFCSTSGYCQNHEFAGRRKIALDLCRQKSDVNPTKKYEKETTKTDVKETETNTNLVAQVINLRQSDLDDYLLDYD